MKKLMLVLLSGLYGLMLLLSLREPDILPALLIEIYAPIIMGLVALTLTLPMKIQWRYAVMAHLLVISSLRIPTVVYTMEQAKTIAFGYPFTFVRQDHSEWIGVSVFDGGKFPYTERLMLRLNDVYWSTLSHIDYGAMICSSLVVFLLLLTGRQILKKIGSWIGI